MLEENDLAGGHGAGRPSRRLVELEGVGQRLPQQLEVVIAETGQGRGILGVIDGGKPTGIEGKEDIAWRKGFLRQIGYKQ